LRIAHMRTILIFVEKNHPGYLENP